MRIALCHPVAVVTGLFTASSICAFSVVRPPLRRSSATALHIMGTNQQVSERLEQAQLTWQSVTSLTDEILLAEKTLVESLNQAEKAAAIAIASTGPVTNEAPKNAIVGLLRAAESITEAAAAAVTADSQAVEALAKSASDVKESIERAQKVVELVASTTADIQKDATKAALESASIEVVRSIQAADALADTVTQVASADALAVSNLESTTVQALENSMEQQQAITVVEVSAAVESTDVQETAVVNSINDVVDKVVEDLEVTEKIAETVATVAQADASAVTSLDDKADEVVKLIQEVEAAVEKLDDPSAGESMEVLKVVASQAADKIEADGMVIEAVAAAVTKDAMADQEVVEALKVADAAVDNIVNAAAGEVASNTAVTVATLDSQAESVTKALECVHAAAIECTECAAKAVEGMVAFLP